MIGLSQNQDTEQQPTASDANVEMQTTVGEIRAETPQGAIISEEQAKDTQAPEVKGLTPREQSFVEHYLRTGNATQACKDAGYKCKSNDAYRTYSSNVFRRPHIAQAIAQRRSELQAKERQRTELTRELILDRLLELAELAMQRIVIKMEGKAIVQYQPQASARCWELLGKEMGMFIDRTADVSDTIQEREKQLALLKKAQAIVDREAKREEERKLASVNA